MEAHRRADKRCGGKRFARGKEGFFVNKKKRKNFADLGRAGFTATCPD
jgi:hypothetical protein